MAATATNAAVVIPVRYMARGRAVYSTSTHVAADFVRVRASTPPTAGLVVAMQLYVPGADDPIAVDGTVRDVSFGTNAFFTAELGAIAPDGRARIAAFLASIDGRRACDRFPVDLPILLRDAFTAGDGVVKNLSASGLFVQTDLDRGVGSRVRGEIRLPGDPEPQEFEAEVVRVAEQPKGVGLQLVGGTDQFRSLLTSYLRGLSV